MKIRKYEDKDEDCVVALWREVLPDSSPHNDPATSIQKKLAVDRDLLLVCSVDGSVVGTVMGGYDGHRGWIYSLAVKPERQRQGVATALVRQLEKELMGRGCLKVNLQVRASNEKVVALYKKLGYKTEERISMGKRLYGEETG